MNTAQANQTAAKYVARFVTSNIRGQAVRSIEFGVVEDPTCKWAGCTGKVRELRNESTHRFPLVGRDGRECWHGFQTISSRVCGSELTEAEKVAKVLARQSPEIARQYAECVASLEQICANM